MIDTIRVNDELRTNLSAIECALRQYGAEVLCVLTTTSCFAPRVPDDLISVSQLCRQFDVYHLVNNAYGIQSTKCCHLIEQVRFDVFDN